MNLHSRTAMVNLSIIPSVVELQLLLWLLVVQVLTKVCWKNCFYALKPVAKCIKRHFMNVLIKSRFRLLSALLHSKTVSQYSAPKCVKKRSFCFNCNFSDLSTICNYSIKRLIKIWTGSIFNSPLMIHLEQSTLKQLHNVSDILQLNPA